MELSVVLPAYNEAQNLPKLLGRIDGSLKDSSLTDYQIIVVDDGSNDGTAEMVRTFESEIPVRLVRHPRNCGLGAALQTGLTEAMSQSRYVVTMDADNSHDPKLILDMIQRLREGNDVVIASRFCEGGRMIGVSLFRSALSGIASCLLRWIFPYSRIQDYSSGYRAYRTSALRHAMSLFDAPLVSERGFACMLELLLKLRLTKAHVSEVPLVLRYDFKEGPSKMRIFRTIRRYGAVIWRSWNMAADLWWQRLSYARPGISK